MHLEFRLKMHLGSILKMIRLLILLIDISTGHWDYNATKFITFCVIEFFMVLWKFINPRWIWMCIKLLCYSTLDLYNFKGVGIVWTSVKIFRLFMLSKLIFPLKFWLCRFIFDIKKLYVNELCKYFWLWKFRLVNFSNIIFIKK